MAGKILSVVGARPQFVKAAVVSEQIGKVGLDEVIVHTGQHYDANMSDVFFTTLGIPAPKYNLGIGGGSHAEMTGRQLIGVEQCIQAENPALVLVYGDTNSTLAAALAAVKLHVPIAHVEAGLRSFNERMPEEINRILTDRIARILFTPSDVASNNLRAEGVDESRIVQVGDVMYDAALRYGSAPTAASSAGLHCVVTIHRAENTDDHDRLRTIVGALLELAHHMDVVFPVHPRTRAALERLGLWERLATAIDVVEPLGYIEMLAAVRAASVVITDSGGLQKEAYFLATPCVTLRGETEWTETVALGWNRLVTELTVPAVVTAAEEAKRPGPSDAQPYGDGRAAERIACYLAERL